MSIGTDCFTKAKNIDSPFTELFTLLLRPKDLPEGFMPASDADELVAMHEHIDNAMEILFHGLRDLGQILSIILSSYKNLIPELKDVGFLISVLANLTDALNGLRINADDELRRRELLFLCNG